MGKIYKIGRVVVILKGRYAGRKAVVVKMMEDGTNDREFGHVLVAGIDRSPRKVTKSMSKTKILKRSKIKPFVKFINLNHVMPTRYTVDMDLGVVQNANLNDDATREETLKEVKRIFETKYIERGKRNPSGVQFFFKKLRF